MITISSTEFAKNFGQYRELAQREPVAITSHDRVSGYFVSSEEYMRLKSRDRRAYHISELPEETVKAIATARMDSRHDHLNALLDE